MPRYHDAVFGGASVSLENRFLRFEMYKRLTGWGWGELYVPGPSGKLDRFFAVLEHLAEVDLEGLPHPLRLEASTYQLTSDSTGQTLVFEVQLQKVEAPDKTYEGGSALKGLVTLRLPTDEPVLYYELTATPQFMVFLKYLRGPWLRIGANSFGMARHDAIFPGIEWLSGDEWSSGTDWFEHPQALRVAPHPHKVAIPLMAISYDGVGLGFSWTPTLAVLSAGPRLRCPQPIFATPNFVDRKSHHLFGLMWPSARWGLAENALKADPPIQLRKGLELKLDGQITIVPGTSLDVVVDWAKRHGLPEPGAPRWPWLEVLDRSANAYNTNLWVEGQGFGYRGQGNPVVPEYVKWYMAHGRNTRLVADLQAKVDWCQVQVYQPAPASMPPEAQPQFFVLSQPEKAGGLAEVLLQLQTPEGDFPFDPDGRHKTMLLEWANIWRPLGQPGDTALDLCVTAAWAMLTAGQQTGQERFLIAARKSYDYALKFERPEGGDWWETPLSSPNLLAAGNAAIAYYLAFKQWSDERYLAKARHWIRSLLPFTHLWQPVDMVMVYNTKPCFNSTSWFLSDWVSKHVIWEVLMTFANSLKLGINWADIDPEIDWDIYQRGVSTAVLRWMIDHDDPHWMFNSEFSPSVTKDGVSDMMFTDTFDPVNGTYGGGPISPELVAQNAIIVLTGLKQLPS